MKFFIYNRGGLGDTIRRYIGGGDGWEYLDSLKAKFPDARVNLITMSSNPQTPEFFKYHPHIDKIVVKPWKNPNHKLTNVDQYGDGYKSLLNHSILSKLSKTQPEVYLNQQDQKVVSEIANGDKYIVIHPFSSESKKIRLPIKEYFPLVDYLIDRLKYKIIIIGADWTETRNESRNRSKTERFPYKRDGLINLINQTNSRTSIRLVQKSSGLIAVRSFCFSSTISGKIKTVLIVADGTKPVTYPGVNWTIDNLKQWGWPLTKNIKVIGSSHKAKFNTVRADIINHFAEPV